MNNALYKRSSEGWLKCSLAYYCRQKQTWVWKTSGSQKRPCKGCIHLPLRKQKLYHNDHWDYIPFDKTMHWITVAIAIRTFWSNARQHIAVSIDQLFNKNLNVLEKHTSLLQPKKIEREIQIDCVFLKWERIGIMLYLSIYCTSNQN